MTIINAAATPASVNGSNAEILFNIVPTNRVAKNNPTAPRRIPQPINLNAFFKIIRDTVPCVAPIATRTPISLRLCVTLVDSSPYNPSALSNNTRSPKKSGQQSNQLLTTQRGIHLFPQRNEEHQRNRRSNLCKRFAKCGDCLRLRPPLTRDTMREQVTRYVKEFPLNGVFVDDNPSVPAKVPLAIGSVVSQRHYGINLEGATCRQIAGGQRNQ